MMMMVMALVVAWHAFGCLEFQNLSCRRLAQGGRT
jgi:hypothetical protein